VGGSGGVCLSVWPGLGGNLAAGKGKGGKSGNGHLHLTWRRRQTSPKKFR